MTENLTVCEARGDGAGGWVVDVARASDAKVMATLQVTEALCPPRKSARGKVVWSLPSDRTVQPRLGLKESQAVLAAYKKQRKLLIQFVVLPRKMGTGRDSLEAPVRLRPHALPLGVKDVFLFATEAGAPAWLTLGFEHVGSSASLIHLRFDLLFKRDRGVLARSARGPETSRLAAARWTARSRSSATPRASTPWSAVQERVAEYGEKQVVRLAKEAANAAAEAEADNEAAPPAPAPRRRAAASKKRVVDDADADDEDEAWEPGRPSMMDLDDDEQEQAAKAKRKLKRRSKKKSAKAKNAAGAAPHAPVSAPPAAAAAAPPEPSTTIAPAATQPVPAPAAAAAPPPRPLPKIRVFPQLSEVQKARLRMKDQEHIRRAARLHEAVTQEQERNAFLERIQAEEVRREQARIAAARPVPPPPNRATGAGDDSDEGWEESDDDPVEDLIHRERIRERDLLRTPGCLALGRKAFRLEDMPRVTERDREILRRTAPGRAEVHIKELGFHFIDPLAPIAEKEIVPRVRVFIPYLGIEGWISITSRGPASFSTPQSFVRRVESLARRALGRLRLDDGHLIVELKYLQAMHVKNRMLKKCCYTLYLLELADRLRGEASRETLKTARKNVVEVRSRVRDGADDRFDMVVLARPTLMRVIRKFANAIARKAAEARGETFVPTPYDETAVDAVVVTAVPPVAPVVSAPAGPPLKALEAMGKKELGAELDAAGVPSKGRAVKHTAIEVLRNLVRRLRAGEPAASLKATLVADGAKKVVFQYGRPGNGRTLVARWRGL
ncbi:hypothetical protein JL721_6007 [Aureococcus anophagefferens]|nr:hypothetical protein JL721_6007 [Aureococcus anophagefferens]